MGLTENFYALNDSAIEAGHAPSFPIIEDSQHSLPVVNDEFINNLLAAGDKIGPVAEASEEDNRAVYFFIDQLRTNILTTVTVYQDHLDLYNKDGSNLDVAGFQISKDPDLYEIGGDGVRDMEDEVVLMLSKSHLKNLMDLMEDVADKGYPEAQEAAWGLNQRLMVYQAGSLTEQNRYLDKAEKYAQEFKENTLRTEESLNFTPDDIVDDIVSKIPEMRKSFIANKGFRELMKPPEVQGDVLANQ